MLAASCVRGGSDPARSPTREAAPLIEGSLLTVSGFFGGELATIELPDGEPEPVRMPLGLIAAAYVMDDGSVLALVENQFGRISAHRSTPVGDAIAVGRPAPRDAESFSLGGNHLLAASCGEDPGAYLLDLDAPTRWQRLKGGCGAVLSPDGASMAWSPDGHRVMQASTAPGTDPVVVLDVADVSRLPGLAGARIAGEMRWGDGGLAVPIAASERQGMIVVDGEGDVHATPLGPSGAGLTSVLSWQPGGDVLAAASWSNLEGVVRTIDGDAARIVGLLPDPTASLVWSPDGDILLAGTDARWSFVTTDGEWLRSIPVPRGMRAIGWGG